MSKNIIYCYSGSGNCLDMSKTIARFLGDTDIVMMRSYPAVTDTSGAKRVGFVFPCYAGGLPGNVEKFVRDIKIQAGTYTFAIVSYAGYPGTGLAKINKIHKLDYYTGISHHCSCIWLMPHTLTIPPLPLERSQQRFTVMAWRAASDIMSMKQLGKAPSNPAVNRIEASAWPLLAKIKAKKFTVASTCIGCGQCARLCPNENISIKNGRAVIGKNCIGCLSCLQYCPEQAINLGKVTINRERYTNINVKPLELTEKVIHFE